MRKFDLEAAKRGDPVEAIVDGEWTDVKFVGLGYDCDVIVDHLRHGSLRIRSTDNLRMAPRKTTIAIELWRDDRSGRFASRVVHSDGCASDACLFGEKIDTIPYVVFE